MDIHENEDQLGDVEPMPQETDDLEQAAEAEVLNPEVEEENQPAGDVEEIQETLPEADVVEDDLPLEADEVDEPSDMEEEIPESDVMEEDLPVETEEVAPEDTDLEEEVASEVEVTDEELEPDETDVPEDDRPDPYASVSAQEKPVRDSDDGRAWYVVHCYSGNEDKVRHNIMQRIESMSMDDLIFDVVVPTEDEVNIKNGERQTVEKKVFPGYILVNMILTEESWYMVRNTPGVTGFVGMGNDPTPLQPEEVARILKRMESESPRINITFRPGERVRIVDGPFEDFYGKVAEIDMERATVRVMVNFFGRETPVELDFLQVEQA